jgi:hypothetical protein
VNTNPRIQTRSGRVIITFLLLLCFDVASAQTDSVPGITKITSSQIGLEIGFIKGYFKDLNYSPLNYTEGGTMFSLSYSRNNPKSRHMFAADIDFASGQMKSGAQDFFYTDHTLVNLELSFLWRMRQPKNKDLSFFLGPQYNSFIQYLDWNDQSSWTYLATHGLHLKGFLSYKPSARRRFETSISIPFVQLFVRPPYNGYDLYIQEHSEDIMKLAFRGEVASFNKYIAVDWKTVYRYAASNHLDFVFGYLFRYQSVSGYNKLTHFQNQFTFGFAIKF